jgi:hypothetical protein
VPLGFKLTVTGHGNISTTVEVSIEEDQIPQGVCIMRVNTSGDPVKNVPASDQTKEVSWSTMAFWVADLMVSVLSGFKTQGEYDATPPRA